MATETLTLVHLSGICAILGAFGYLVGDILLLSIKVDIGQYPALQPHVKLLDGAEKLVGLPSWRIIWGGLVAVFATPLYLAGLWHMAYGLLPAGDWWVWPPALLMAIGFIIAPFVHGSFMYWAEYVKALNAVSQESQTIILEMLRRHRTILIASYGVVIIAIVAASFWFSAAVAIGDTSFPRWLALFNPVTLLIIWLVLRKGLERIIPAVTELLEGAGFNLVFMVFFLLTTISVW
jgi:hypothetical protein